MMLLLPNLFSQNTNEVSAESTNLPGMEITDLGTQIMTTALSRAIVTEDENGEPIMYATVDAKPGKLFKIDLNTNEVMLEIPLTDTVDGETEDLDVIRGLTVTPDGTVYIAGSYTHHLFKYTPGDEEVESVGAAIPGDRTMDMVSSEDGLVFGGTYGTGKAYIYDTTMDEFTDLGQIHPPEQYVYSLDYDEETNTLYLGIGANAHIIKYDLDTGEKSEIPLPDEYKDYDFIFDLYVKGGKVFAVLSPGTTTLVYDKETEEMEYLIPRISSRDVSPVSPNGENIFYTNNNILHSYHIADEDEKSLEFDVGGNSRGFGFAQLDDTDFPGDTLIGITETGRLFKYNEETGNKVVQPIELGSEPADLHSIAAGSDGKIHLGAYLGEGTAFYDPETGETTQFTAQTVGAGNTIYQPESIILYKDKIIYSGYPDTSIYMFDPDLAWNLETGHPESNPIRLFNMKEWKQDRPFATIGLESQEQLAIGTVPGYGDLGGTLTFYDFESGTVDVHENIVQNQSVVSLEHKDGMIFGGTSIWGGLGVDPTEEEAKLFMWDMETGEKVFETTPVSGKKAITALITGSDGNIWGFAEGSLFIFDPDTKEVIYNEEKFNRSYSGATWRDATLELGTNGNIFGVIGGEFFMIDAISKDVTSIRDGGYRSFTQDPSGDFYLVGGGSMWRATMDQTNDLETVTLETETTSLSPGESISLTLHGEMSNGEEVPLEDARIIFQSDQPDLVTIGEDGQLTLAGHVEDVRSFKVWVDVTLDDTKVSSNVLEFDIAVSVSMMLDRLEYLRDELSSEGVYRHLNIHLTAVEHFIEQDKTKKVVKHMHGFEQLLDHLKEKEQISEEAYNALKSDAASLIKQWQ